VRSLTKAIEILEPVGHAAAVGRLCSLNGEGCGMTKDVPVKGRRSSLLLPTAGIALTTPFLVWFAVGDLSFKRTSPDHMFGPYQVARSPGTSSAGWRRSSRWWR
jgi:hypothetical protein